MQEPKILLQNQKKSYFLRKKPTNDRNTLNKINNEKTSKSRIILQFSTDKRNISDASLQPWYLICISLLKTVLEIACAYKKGMYKKRYLKRHLFLTKVNDKEKTVFY